MRVSYDWLKTMIDIPEDPKTLSDEYIRTGTEVEAIDTVGESFDHVVTAKVLTKTPHPDSDHMYVCSVDVGDKNLDADGKVLINGAMGITGIKKASTFTIGIVLVIITLAVILNLVNSRAGRAITSIRDNEIAARSVGIPITKYKLMAFVTSAVFAGMAGVLYSLNYSSLVAKKFDYNTSILILVFVVLGGIGNLRGSVIAATVLTVLPELLRSMNDYRMLIYTIVLIVVMIFNQSPQMIAMRKRLTARFRKDAADRAPKKNKKEAA